MNRDFWRGKRVFVTGHTGFKGGWLCTWLKELGAEVNGYALSPPVTPNLFEVANVAQGMRSVIGDVRDLPALKSAMAECAPDVVFHMAAQPLVRASYVDPVETYSTNVIGTVNLFEAVRSVASVGAVVNVTTDKCYENREWVWGYRENEPMGGSDPYSSSKGCAELVSSAYRSSFLPNIATARAGNVIGGGDWSKDRLIPDVLAAFARGEAVSIRNPSATRPWQHVLEPLRGYLMLAERLYTEGKSFAEAWNFGPRDEDCRPVSDVTDQLVSLWGEGARWQRDAGQHPHEAHFLKLDVSKANARLGWSPRMTLATGLQLTVEWFKAWKAGNDMHQFTLKQIERHG